MKEMEILEAKIDKAELTTNLADKTQEQGDDKQLKINSIKKLYHGTNKLFDSVDLNRCGRFKDFGQGYYLTTDLKQAQKWAQYKAEDATGDQYCFKTADALSVLGNERRFILHKDDNGRWRKPVELKDDGRDE